MGCLAQGAALRKRASEATSELVLQASKCLKTRQLRFLLTSAAECGKL